MNEAVARRYASALADVALEQIKADQVKKRLRDNSSTPFIPRGLCAISLKHRRSGRTKAQGDRKVTEKMALDPAVRNFIYLIVDHRRTELLREIRQAFQKN